MKRGIGGGFVEQTPIALTWACRTVRVYIIEDARHERLILQLGWTRESRLITLVTVVVADGAREGGVSDPV